MISICEWATRYMKRFQLRPGQCIWLLRCWDTRASSLELEAKEVKQLESLPGEEGSDKVFWKVAQILSLWRWLLSGMKKICPFKEDVLCHPGKWATMQKGIQYLKELAVLEVIYDDLVNKQVAQRSRWSQVHSNHVARTVTWQTIKVAKQHTAACLLPQDGKRIGKKKWYKQIIES